VYASVESDAAHAVDANNAKRSAAVLNLFERAATPLGQVERAQAALAVANALVDRPDLNRKPARKVAAAAPTQPMGLKKPSLRRAKPAAEAALPSAAAPVYPPRAAPASTVGGTPAARSPVAGRLGGNAGTGAAGEEGERFSSPGPDFWSWVPPERQLQKATQPQVRAQPRLWRHSTPR
jgi:hypothetical protein